MVRLLSLPHSTTEVCPTTPDMPVFEDRPVSETDENVATALHAMHPATAIHTSQDRDAQLGTVLHPGRHYPLAWVVCTRVPSAIFSLISPIQRSVILDCCHWYE